MTWRVGDHYGIHVYDGDRPVATFHQAEDAAAAVAAYNAAAVEHVSRRAFCGCGWCCARVPFEKRGEMHRRTCQP